MDGKRLEKEITDKFINSLRDTNLKVIAEDKWQTGSIINWFDIVIYRGNSPFAVIEIKSITKSKSIITMAIAMEQVRSAMSITNSRYGIITNGIDYYLCDRNYKKRDFVITTYEKIINALIKPRNVKIPSKNMSLVWNMIKEAAESLLSDNKEFLDFIRNKSFKESIKFDPKANVYYFSDSEADRGSFENNFFNKLIGEFKETQICRYTTLKSAFEMFNNLSFRMSGLIGMNDKSEVNYVETYLNSRNNHSLIAKPLIKEDLNTISEINNRYITSCTSITMLDNLTLWRLYSDDAKGICFVFDVLKAKLNNHIILKKVKYADENGTHKELDLIKKFREEIELQTGFAFEFRNLGYWKHFFKAFDYKVENEVRLLVVDNPSLPKLRNDWVMTYTHSILNPVLDLALNSKSFPIQLRKVIIGPKCPEQETNFVQLREMIKKKNLDAITQKLDCNLKDIKIELSAIKHYR